MHPTHPDTPRTAGKAVTFLGFPASSGEVLAGMLLGPGLGGLSGSLSFTFLTVLCHPSLTLSLKVTFDARAPLMLAGEIGLYMLVLEAGVEVDLAMLKMLGLRGLAVAVLGSFLPLAIGLGLATAVGLPLVPSIVVGVSLAPTSMGFALINLKAERCLNTPTGQLVVAAASESRAKREQTPLLWRRENLKKLTHYTSHPPRAR